MGYFVKTTYTTDAGVASQQIINNPVTAGSFVTGFTYQIVTNGTTDFTLIGAVDSNPGTVFTATGPGTGTGTAGAYDFYIDRSSTADNILVIVNGITQDPDSSAYTVSTNVLSFTDYLATDDIVSVRFFE